MKDILNYFSAIVTFLFLTGVIYIILDLTLGKIKKFHSSFKWRGLQIKDFVFLIIALILMILFFHPYYPYI